MGKEAAGAALAEDRQAEIGGETHDGDQGETGRRHRLSFLPTQAPRWLALRGRRGQGRPSGDSRRAFDNGACKLHSPER